MSADSTNPINELNEKLGATPGESDEGLRGERNMTNSGPEKHRPNNEEDLSVALLQGTSKEGRNLFRTLVRRGGDCILRRPGRACEMPAAVM